MVAVVQGPDGGQQQLRRRVKVGEPLRQIDSLVGLFSGVIPRMTDSAKRETRLAVRISVI